ncbi:MAG: hypothetical protein AMXMBFR66_31500 [Pseudomonadota bacterium]|nr:TonB-dependent receptor [Rubrivivax sp.]
MLKRSKVALAAAVVVAGGVGATSAWAQTEQRIEITGSRIKTLASEGASPVTTITAQEIKIDGQKNVESILNNLPQVFADQNSTVSNGASGTASVNLRGLGSSRTLVLVNGRRMPMGSAIDTSPDLNEIPAGLIRRVDVLTGGASAVYGSDAVSGVVNFILDDRFQGVEVELNHSFYNHRQQNAAGIGSLVAARGALNPNEFKLPGNKSSDGKSTSLSLLMGSNFGDSGNATLYVSYKKDDALLQSERDFSSCAVAAGAAGFSCGGSGTAATGRITNLADGNVWTTADAAGNARAYKSTDAYNYGPTNYYQRPSERWTGRGSLSYDITKTARAYANLSFHDDNTIAQVAPGGIFGNIETVRYDNPLLTQSWRTALGLVNPGDSTDVVVQRRNVEGGGRQSQYRNTSFRTEAGVKGDIGNWSYDVYGIAARVIYSQSLENYFLDPKIDKAFDVVNNNGTAVCASAQSGADPNCVPYNVWKLGGVTPDQLAYLQTPGLQKGSTFLEMLGATASADLGDYGAKLPWAKSGLGVSLGVESRREKLDLTVDDASLTGALSGTGGPTLPLSGGYGVKEAFGELRIPIADGVPGANALAASLTARNSDYSTGKHATTYGLGLEYGPIKEVKLRSSVQRAIRAPNLIEMFQAQGNNLFDLSNGDPCSGPAPARSLADCQRTGVTPAQYGKIQDSPAKQFNYLQGGNPGLDPETADSLTFGLALAPMNNLTLTFDYFDIKVKKAIGNLDPTVILDKCLDTGDALFCKLVQRDRLGTLWLLQEGRIVATNQNLGSLRTTGWDFSASYMQRLGSLGSLTLNFSGTQLQKLMTEPIPGGGSYDCVGLYGSSKCGSPNPKWRHKLRAVWATPWDFDFAATWRHLDKVMQQETSSQPMLAGASNPVERELSARDYLDLAAVWRATKSLSIMVGINNVLDRDPPITSQQGPSVFGNGNTFPGTYDALGRKVFLTGSYKF